MILKTSGSDVKRLPLSAVEAYVLSRLDGLLDLDAVAEMTGIDAAEVQRVGAYLVELGAAVPVNGKSGGAGSYALRPPASADDRSSEPRPRRRDPRAEETMFPPSAPSAPKTSRPPRTVRPPKMTGSKTMAPPKSKTLAPPRTVRPPKSKTMAPPRSKTVAPPKSKTVRPPKTIRPDASAPDEASLEAIAALEARIGKGTHYEVLGVARDADKKTIKRAYFALAAEAHPDRFFQKKIGKERARVELLFRRLTEAHDALTDPQQRRMYDARLPPLPKAAPGGPVSGRRSSRGMKAVSRRMAAVTAPPVSSVPVSSGRVTAPVSSGPVTAPISAPLSAPVVTLPPVITAPPASGPTSVSPAMRPPPVSSVNPAGVSPTLRSAVSSPGDAAPISGAAVARAADLRAGMLAARTQARVEMLVKAGEDALAAGDLIGAANNYRLALEHREDLRLRFIYEDLDARARTMRFEKNMSAARLAEAEQRWADAAVFLERAHQAKPDCDVAHRAAMAIRQEGGDLPRALGLAEDAVRLAPRNPQYRLTLAALCLAAKRGERAREECEEARKLAPKDDHIQSLAREIARKI